MSASPSKPSPVRPVQYKGSDLDAARGPGLGCFRFQLVLLLILVVLTPFSVMEDWPSGVSAGLLFLTIALLLVAGQTIIFLLRLVAADRAAGRRRPMASRTLTVGEIEDATRRGAATAAEPTRRHGADEAAEGGGVAEPTRRDGADEAAEGGAVAGAAEGDGAREAAVTDPARSDGPLPSPRDMRQ